MGGIMCHYFSQNPIAAQIGGSPGHHPGLGLGPVQHFSLSKPSVHQVHGSPPRVRARTHDEARG